MKPSQFEYVRANSIKQAIAALAAGAGDAKILAGGQSLVPMLNFRLLSPSVLIDINRIPGLDRIEEGPGGALRIGALTRHRALETSAVVKRLFPVISEAMTHVAHLAIRNRGTTGGSLTHADPAAELPMLAVLLDAEITTASPAGGRSIKARDFFVAALTSAAAQDEIVVRIDLPALPPKTGWAFEEFSRRPGDFALAAVAVLLSASAGRVTQSRIAMMGVGETPMRATGAEALLGGQACDEGLIDKAVEAVRASVEPNTDLHASADYRRHLVGVLARRAIATAWKRALGESA